MTGPVACARSLLGTAVRTRGSGAAHLPAQPGRDQGVAGAAGAGSCAPWLVACSALPIQQEACGEHCSVLAQRAGSMGQGS